jgi:hypothetical protein
MADRRYALIGHTHTGLGSSAAWGSITGTLADQTDLQSALDAKSATSHTHSGVYEPVDATIVRTGDAAWNATDWDTAFGWGDHASTYSLLAHNHAGVYEPVDATLVRDDDAGYNNTDWDTAFGWGDHAGLYPTINGAISFGTLVGGVSNSVATITDIHLVDNANIAADQNLNFYIDMLDASTTKKFNWYKNAGATSGATLLMALNEAGTLEVDSFKVSANTAFSSGDGPKFYKQSTLGAVIQGVTGSTNDLALITPGGQILLGNTTGTNNLTMVGALAVAGAVTGSNLNVSNWDTAYGWGDHASGGYYNGTDSLTLSGGSRAISVLGGVGTASLELHGDSAAFIDFSLDGTGSTDNSARIRYFNDYLDFQGVAAIRISDIEWSTTDIANHNTSFGWGDWAASVAVKINTSAVNWADVTSDMDANFNRGNFRVNNTATNQPIASQFYATMGYGNGSNVHAQLATHFQDGKTYTRAYNTSWTAWKLMWSDSDFSATDVTNWDTAYGWGDHADAGYAEGGGVTKLKLFDEAVTSSTTLQDDNYLTGFSITAGEVYKIEGCLFMDSPGNADFKMDLAFTNTPIEYILGCTATNQSGSHTGDLTDAALANIFIGTSSSAMTALNLYGYISANASTGGTFKLQWAQNTSFASNTTVHAGSWMTITQIS